MRIGWREIAFLFVLVAMPVASYWFVFKPENTKIQEARKEIEHKEMMLDKLAAATKQTADLKAANNEITSGIALIEDRLPNSTEVDVILKQVADLARQNKLELPKVRTVKRITSSRFVEQPLEMTMKGRFEDFYSFLLDLENLPRITRVPNLTLERSRDDDGAVIASFTLSIYFEPDGGA